MLNLQTANAIRIVPASRLPLAKFSNSDTLLRCVSPVLAVRPEGAKHLWRRVPPGELSIDPEADERLGRVTGGAGAS